MVEKGEHTNYYNETSFFHFLSFVRLSTLPLNNEAWLLRLLYHKNMIIFYILNKFEAFLCLNIIRNSYVDQNMSLTLFITVTSDFHIFFFSS